MSRKTKVLLLFPRMYTLVESFKSGFLQNDCELMHYDYRDDISTLQSRIQGHIGKVPYGIREKWYATYVHSVNLRHLHKFNEFTPDIVLVYNSELLLPETVKLMQRSAKVCFFLGDSPFYTPQNDFYLPCLMQADHIFCPDTYWEKQLRGMGFPSTHYFMLGSNPAINRPVQVSAGERRKWESDLVFVGVSYMTAVGFKRALFLNQFASLDIRIYTNRKFERWFAQFPDLKSRVIFPENRLSDEEVNTILNCCKIYPVDANPGLINGVHLRIFDCIASGILPLAEYRKDILRIFGKEGLPMIYDYRQGAAQARYYLDHEDERIGVIQNLMAFVQKEHSPQQAIARLLDLASGQV